MGGSAAIFTCLMYILAPIIAGWMDIEQLSHTISVLAVFIPAIYAKNYCSAILKGTGNNVVEIFLSQVVFLSVTFGLGVFFWMKTHSTAMVVAGHGIGYVVTLCIFTFYAWRHASTYRLVKSEAFRLMELLSHGLPLNITALAQRIFQRADVIIIGTLLNEHAVGLYKVAFAAASGIKHLITPLNNFAGYWLGIYAGSKQKDNMRRYYMGLVMSSLVLTLPAYFLLFILAGDVIPVIFGDEYKAAILLTQILCLGFIYFTAVGPMGTLFNTVGRNWVRMWLVIGMSIFNIAANIILIRLIGVTGTAISTCFSFMLLFFIFHFIVKRYFIGFITPPHPLILLLCVTGIGVMSLFLPLSIIEYRIAAACAGTFAVGVLSFAATWHYLKIFDAEIHGDRAGSQKHPKLNL